MMAMLVTLRRNFISSSFRLSLGLPQDWGYYCVPVNAGRRNLVCCRSGLLHGPLGPATFRLNSIVELYPQSANAGHLRGKLGGCHLLEGCLGLQQRERPLPTIEQSLGLGR